MIKKIGRPLKNENPLIHDLKIRIDDNMHKKLLDYCKVNQTNKADVIRKAISNFLK